MIYEHKKHTRTKDADKENIRTAFTTMRDSLQDIKQNSPNEQMVILATSQLMMLKVIRKLIGG